jgi:hypothetical protein
LVPANLLMSRRSIAFFKLPHPQYNIASSLLKRGNFSLWQREGRRDFTNECRHYYETVNDGLVKSRLTGENRCPVFS